MKSLRTKMTAAALLLITAAASHATVVAFVSNPSTNSVAWAAAVVAAGGTINTNVNFDSHPLGGLQGNFYAVSDGVTLTTAGDSNTVQFGAGPGQGNTVSGPLSTGEGLHAASGFLFDGGLASSLTISFATPVLGVGLFMIDYFNPSNNNPLSIEAFTGVNGTGSSLGSFSSVAFNFQSNYQYFMGIASTNNDIGSLIFRDLNSNTGDTTGIDNIRFAVRAQVNQIPEPSLLALLGLGVAGLGLMRRRRPR